MEEQTYKYFCDKCQYGTNTKFNFQRHLKSNGHLGLPRQSICRELVRYHCPLCSFHTRFRGDWNCHVETQKHKDAVKWNNMNRLQRAYAEKKKDDELARHFKFLASKDCRKAIDKENNLLQKQECSKERRALMRKWTTTITGILFTLRLTREFLPSTHMEAALDTFRENLQNYKERKNIKSLFRSKKTKKLIIIKN